jgi:Trk K+ transport system NAD-binding subunit
MLSDGVDVFKVRTPESFIGKSIDELRLRETIGCHVVASTTKNEMRLISSGEDTFTKDSEIIMIANSASESKFLQLYGKEM